MKRYLKRVWLNSKKSSFTGSVCAYYGQATWSKKPEKEMFFEIGDCYQKIRIHVGKRDRVSAYIKKIRTIAKVANDYADWIEKNHKNN